ncbi:glycosyltransferase family 2 protein [Albimonas pacifica]|uniref:Glycosyltransferase, GT2 family n=1 Tax=Albimonas pacifica TaxID=1114924 RepID=A0A1I3IKZ8_9RHOB|nr:glycosyltransferase [Albimonas pacifica]SFI48592.1 Glycosyltransferase, GT2 family [Albimonas pacifica]
MTSPALGLVAIGRNEGERLRRCLASARALLGPGAPLVYVDSGSTDASLAIAAEAGARIVEIAPAEGFTAARARNLGAAALAGAAPEFIQFVDGDCELVAGWLETAQARLRAEPGLAVVAGRRRERAPGASIFNRLCDMEWNTPVGRAAAVGGDALYRREAFEAVGGFDPAFICGEEPELCLRLARAGWGIERLDAEMTLHDADMHRWSQWRRRAERTGWAFAEGADRYGDGPEGYNRREARRSLAWGLGLPGALLVSLALAALGAGALAALLALGALGLAGLVVLRAARWRRGFGDPWPHALLYGGLAMAGKPFEALGAWRYRRAKARGERGRIIEYKGPARSTGS